MNRPTLYVFDFDGTLTKGDTFLPFLRHIFGKQKVIRTLVRFLPQLILMRLHILNNGKVKERLWCYLFKGMNADIVDTFAHSFAQRHTHLWRQTALQLIQTIHQSPLSTPEHTDISPLSNIVILTASLGCWVKPFVKQQIPNAHVIATEAETDNENRLTGQFATPNCYGQEKVTRLRQVLPQLHEYHIIAYGDSKGDKQILSIANESHYKAF